MVIIIVIIIIKIIIIYTIFNFNGLSVELRLGKKEIDTPLERTSQSQKYN